MNLYTKISGKLAVTVSALSLMYVASAQARETTVKPSADEGFMSRVGATMKSAWQSAPDLGVIKTVKSCAVSLATNQAEAILEKAADDIANAASLKFHALIYRDTAVHVVNDKGEHIGYVETQTPMLARKFLKNQLGFDLEKDIPGVPIFLATTIANYAEKMLAHQLEKVVFKSVNAAVKKATLLAVGKAMGIAEDRIEQIIQSRVGTENTTAKAEDLEIDKSKVAEEIKTKLASKPLDDIEQEAYSKMGAALIGHLKAKFKIKLNNWVQDAVRDVATNQAQYLIDSASEKALKCAEVGLVSGAAAVSGIATGGTLAPVVVAGLAAGDANIAGNKEDSWLRSFTKTILSYDERVSSLKDKAAFIINTVDINGALEKIPFTKWLATTAEDYDKAEGKHTHETLEDEDGLGEEGFTIVTKIEKPFNFNALIEETGAQIAKAKAAIAQAASKAATTAKTIASAVKKEAVHATEAFVGASEDFFDAMHPPLFDDEDFKAEDSKPAASASKPWYKFW